MKIIPHSKKEWLSFALLPFKAYVVISPVLFFISSSLPRPRHTGATDFEAYLVLGLFPCSMILLFASLVLAFVGPKGAALPCAGFGAVAFFIGFLLLPSLVHS